MTTLLTVGHTHLFPGARGRVEGPGAGVCMVRFSDGVEAPGEIADGVLSLAPHVTAAGIPARRRAVKVGQGAFRVVRRLRARLRSRRRCRSRRSWRRSGSRW